MIRESTRIIFSRRRFYIIVIIFVVLNILFISSTIGSYQRLVSLNRIYKYAVLPSVESLLLADVFYILPLYLSDIVSEEKDSSRVIFLKSLFKGNTKRYLLSKVLSAIIVMSVFSVTLSLTLTEIINFYLVGLSSLQMLEISVILSIILVVINIQMVGLGSLFNNPKISIVFNFLFYSVFYNGTLIYILEHGFSHYYLDLVVSVQFFTMNNVENRPISLLFSVIGGTAPHISISLSQIILGILINLAVGVIPIIYSLMKIGKEN
ncbi:hypothetical protein [Stygiolobus caldivivus]|uniref:Uncharacterized protein n=1 Tax=Stygiolobus caldivivus TaxID=2824673 RepID=A0A8D5U5D3_9CREN|nr:hypothetical protein [Stygiolobus caldivivus]BCU69791.1 hypothetical protein KN1_10880 [Stygiolobus caldivivus]